MTREDGGRCAEPAAVLGHRELIGLVRHRANMLDKDAAFVGCVVDRVQVGANVMRARREVALLQLHDHAHVVAVITLVSIETPSTNRRFDAPRAGSSSGGQARELRFERRKSRRMLRL